MSTTKDEKEIAIKVDDVFKSFRIPHEKNNSIRSAVLNFYKKRTYTQHDAAKGISFEVKKGEFLGIIGRNGCGKSTMLKMLAKIYVPNKGKITINGRLSPFLELGVGFNPELSARDNVYLNGAILGLTRKEIDEKYDEIIRFAELEEFVDQKLKNFSSGMQVRLAFSVAIQAHAEILLIDEVLAVGDANFKKKCEKIFYKLKEKGKTIIFVTHSMEQVKQFCDRAILIDQGKIVHTGSVEETIFEYEKLNISNPDKIKGKKGKKVEIKRVKFFINNKKTEPIFNFNDSFDVLIRLKNNTNKKTNCNFSIGLYQGNCKCFISSTIHHKQSFNLEARKEKEITFRISKSNLLPGTYDLTLKVFGSDYMTPFDLRSDDFRVMIIGETKETGVCKLESEWLV